jgi:DNA primase
MLVMRIVERAEKILWSSEGTQGLDYLLGRGLQPETIKEARLGYIPGEAGGWLEEHELRIPLGITIPSFVNGALWQVRVRRFVEKEKYRSISGGKLVGSLFMGDGIKPFQPVIIVEGEFDCLILRQLAGEFCAVAPSSAANTLSKYWLDRIRNAPFVLMRMDDDPAGRACIERHRGISNNIYPVRVPEGHKDVNDLYLKDQKLAQAWLTELLDFYQAQFDASIPRLP